MVRGKTQMRRIENATSRQVTFSKRRNGLLKKAFELSVLCDAEVALIIFSPRGKLYEFANSSMQETIERYRRHVKDTKINKQTSEEDMLLLKTEATNMVKKIELLEIAKRKLLGEGLGACTIEELQQIEQQLERSVSNIRARKVPQKHHSMCFCLKSSGNLHGLRCIFFSHVQNQVFKEQIERLKEKEKQLEDENAKLSEKCGAHKWQGLKMVEESRACEERSPVSDVETELFIGPPETRTQRLLQ
ncbi:MADS-box protein SOC1 isoform X1 [Manihot esculenta]|uniref:MADS-box protein SOC1 isoform X1 n=1 Tax=Manihot esculenta TaxID=3983 RepID=UPI000B5D70C8|nr:MADS-box protein SOC1 isoform X1 [Manihot esculenta]XP_021611929.1 MADS-box protein SOC1 isoform X1 [Manihot esculenta]XP_021611930.1 MADS-box protein SOC1 isoform X1 [Manihot esculenta]XP_021611931.1 MADS-box protein SOC1 isoform X1 [Manihot esculenta]XP_021611932.1 MADS-box protein SOC1 isoform X1 [Manihot esculenta]XP_021611933.1 MADS-box protein SOC1 isoform X1 [Manihot esculenta]XP_021611934.1 MADS-box protein SOC1 isoform X1 [Manihot esculenta]XP_021611935.1 MADS-box protein SOC1 is